MILAVLLMVAPAQSQSNALIEYQALGNVAMTTYRLCLTKKTADYVGSGEPARDVVDAAFGACSSFRLDLAELPKKVGLNMPANVVEENLKWVDEQERKRLLGFVLDVRKKN
jgi:hypothetical protein